MSGSLPRAARSTSRARGGSLRALPALLRAAALAACGDSPTTTARGPVVDGRRLPGDRHRRQRRGHHRRASPRPSSRCRPRPPRCCSPSAPATRSRPSTTTRTTRPRRRPRTCRPSRRTPRRSSATSPTSWCSATTSTASSTPSRPSTSPCCCSAPRPDLDDTYAQMETARRGDRPRRGGRRGRRPTCRTGSTPRSTSVPADVAGQRVYHELDPSLYSADSSHLHRQHLHACSAWRTSPTARPTPSGGYPQLSAEYVVEQAPDLIVLADTKCCGQSAATVAERPGVRRRPRRGRGPDRRGRRRRRVPLGPARRGLRRDRRRGAAGLRTAPVSTTTSRTRPGRTTAGRARCGPAVHRRGDRRGRRSRWWWRCSPGSGWARCPWPPGGVVAHPARPRARARSASTCPAGWRAPRRRC